MKTTTTKQCRSFRALFLLPVAIAAGLALGQVTSPAQTATATSASGKPLMWSADIGFLAQFGSVTALGGNLRASRYLSAADRLTLDVGFAADVNPKVTGHFSYRPSGSSGSWQDDGKVEVSRNLIPLLFGYEHEFQLKNPKLSLRVGPLVGVCFVNANEKGTPRVNNAVNDFRTDSGTGFMGGVNVGLRWILLSGSKGLDNRLYVDFSAAAFGGSKVKLDKFSKSTVIDGQPLDASASDVNLSGGRAVIAVGYRF